MPVLLRRGFFGVVISEFACRCVGTSTVRSGRVVCCDLQRRRFPEGSQILVLGL